MHKYFLTQLEQLLDNLHFDQSKLSMGSSELPWSSDKSAWVRDCISLLYHRGYACGGVYTEIKDSGTDPKTLVPDFNRMERQQSNHIVLDRGWQLERKSSTQDVRITKENVTTIAPPGYYLWDGHAGQNASVSIPKQSVKENEQDVFTYLFGKSWLHLADGDTVRFYANARPEMVVAFVLSVQEFLDRHQIPFVMKFIRFEAPYLNRRDGVVLYITKAYANRVAELLEMHQGDYASFLREGCPLFVLPLKSGLGFGESPPNPQDSFGMSRCRLVAHTLFDLISDKIEKTSWCNKIIDQFEHYNLQLNQIYLNPKSAYHYTFVTESQ